jgi:hypothetical protein
LRIRRSIDDPWGVSISLSNLGDAWRALGDHERALAYFAESIAVNQEAGVVRNELTTRQSEGLTLVDAGRPGDALAILEDVVDGHAEVGDHANRQESLVGVARARLALGDLAGAQAAVDDLLGRQRATDRPELRESVHLVAAAVLRARDQREQAELQLASAGAALREALAAVAPDDRRRMIDAIPTHRAAARALTAVSTTVEVRLATQPPTGGRAAERRVTVTWTLRSPGDPDPASPAGRRAVLARLLDEAAAQGGVPTDDELADALGVSRRTVLRDRAALTR